MNVNSVLLVTALHSWAADWTKVHLAKAVVFPAVMYGCDNWTIKKAEYQRIDAFEMCWRRVESPLDSKGIKPVSPKGNQP